MRFTLLRLVKLKRAHPYLANSSVYVVVCFAGTVAADVLFPAVLCGQPAVNHGQLGEPTVQWFRGGAGCSNEAVWLVGVTVAQVHADHCRWSLICLSLIRYFGVLHDQGRVYVCSMASRMDTLVGLSVEERCSHLADYLVSAHWFCQGTCFEAVA